LSNADQNEPEGLFRFIETSAGFDPYLACEKSKPQFTTLLCAVGFFALGMKTLRLSGVLACLLILTRPSYAQESAKFEKIRDISPDGKFAIRISWSAEPEDPNDIDPNLITAVELVSLPSKKIVINGLGNGEGGAPNVIWSQDSNWLALPVSEGHRVTYTPVYHLSGDDFVPVVGENEELRVDIRGDVRNEYVNPIRWVKPGVLLLEQYDIFRGGEGKDATYRFTVKFDEKTGKFQIISKKKVPSKE
jgi:hypothetical protein